MNERVAESCAEVALDLNEKKPIRVLHVDDEIDVLKTAKQCLEMEGYFQIDTAVSAEEAMKKLERESYDAVISDYQMPGKDGLEFLKELREKGNTVPFIILTGRGREEVAVKALNLGAAQYLNKAGNPETVYGELAYAISQAAERKHAEKRIQESEERYRYLFELAPDALLTLNMKGEVTSCNLTATKLTGYSRDEIVGKHFSKLGFLQLRDVPKYMQVFGGIMSGKVPGPIQVSWHSKDGALRFSEIHVGLIREDSETVGIQVVARDITERRKMEETLRDDEEKMRAILSSSPDAITVFDMNGNVVELNQAAMAMHNFRSKTEIVGRSSFDYVAPRDRARAREVFESTAKLGCVKNAEFALLTKEGKEFLVELSASTVPDANGRPACIAAVMKDITERKSVEKELLENHARLQTILAASSDAITLLDLKGNIVECNEASAGLFGYSSKEELIGKNALEFAAKRDYQRAIKNMKKTIEQGRTANLQYTLVSKKGRETRVEVVANTVRDASGTPTGLVAVVRDITERKKTEDAVRESEEKFRTLFEKANDGLVYVSQSGTIIDINQKALEIAEKKREDILGKPYFDLSLVGSEDIPILLERLKYDESSRQTSSFVIGIAKHNGEKRFIEVNSALIQRDGILAGSLAIVRDVTERKQVQQELLESRQRFEGLFRGNPEAAVYLAPDFHILDINPCFEKLFGYSLPEIKGKHIDDVIVQKEELEEAKTLDKKSIEGYVYHNAMRRRKNGSLVPVSISAAPMIVEGQLIGYVGVYKDISELKRAEKKLETMNEKLRVVGGLTRHDVRNKLFTITGNTYILKKQSAGDSEVVGKLTDIETAVQQSVKIFDFAKAYELLGAEMLTSINVEKTVNEAIALFSDTKNVKTINDCHGLTVRADSLLRQLFYNLIDNSLKYGEKVARIRIHYETNERDRLRLVYEDDGIGISQDAKSKIFSEGYTTGKGSGYGLYLIRKMMEVYGWTIDETGEPNKGVSFVMTIPRTSADGKENYHVA